jgi:hypothetical protein
LRRDQLLQHDAPAGANVRYSLRRPQLVGHQRPGDRSLRRLAAAGNGLVTEIRAWIDRSAIADALGLTREHQVLLSQTVGFAPEH